MTGKDLLDIVLSEGIDIKETPKELSDEFDKAIEEDRVHLIKRDDTTIGFLTWEEVEREGKKRILINKCVVYKRFKHRFNFLELRHYFRALFHDTDCFFWNSKRRKRICYVR